MNLREYAEKKEREQITPGNAEQIYTPLHKEQEERRAIYARSLEICQEYNQNRGISSKVTAAILKGISTGENPYILLIQAADCIGLLTGETKAFSNIVKDRITEIHGNGLEEPKALEIELLDVRRRLAMLTRPELEQTANIKNAIRAHQEREKQIISILENVAG